MRCLIHDFAGHPFQVQLSRELAARGHHVTHAYPVGLQGPKGRLEPTASDPAQLEIRAIPLSAGFRKYSPWRRLAAQTRYARDLTRIVSEGRFDVVMSGNTPIDVQARLFWHCRRNRVGFVHWVQDVYCQALEFFLRSKLGPLGAPLAFPFFRMERFVASGAAANVVIAPAFASILAAWGVSPEKIHVLENWAPLDEISPRPRSNPWSARHGLDSKTVFLYSGTLGMKHQPGLLYQLAQSLDASSEVVVVSEGPGRQYLESMPKLANLRLLDFQPYSQLPDVLATADVLLATLESGAGQFAVPSKILSCLCAGRPLLVAAPQANLAASVVERSAAGIVVDPDRSEDWVAAANLLAANPALRLSLGTHARRYAEHEFDIARIGHRFEAVLAHACGHTHVAAPSKPPQHAPSLYPPTEKPDNVRRKTSAR